VTTLILLRHGRSSANTSGVLAGRSPGVELDDTGKLIFAAAPEPKRHVWIAGAHHNDVFAVAGARFFSELADFEKSLPAAK